MKNIFVINFYLGLILVAPSVHAVVQSPGSRSVKLRQRIEELHKGIRNPLPYDVTAEQLKQGEQLLRKSISPDFSIEDQISMGAFEKDLLRLQRESTDPVFKLLDINKVLNGDLQSFDLVSLRQGLQIVSAEFEKWKGVDFASGIILRQSYAPERFALENGSSLSLREMQLKVKEFSIPLRQYLLRLQERIDALQLELIEALGSANQ